MNQFNSSTPLFGPATRLTRDPASPGEHTESMWEQRVRDTMIARSAPLLPDHELTKPPGGPSGSSSPLPVPASQRDVAASEWGAASLAALQHEDAAKFCTGKYVPARPSFMGAKICVPWQFGLCQDPEHHASPKQLGQHAAPVHRCDFCMETGHSSQPQIKIIRPTAQQPRPSYKIPDLLLASNNTGAGCPYKFASLVGGELSNHSTEMYKPNPWFSKERAEWRQLKASDRSERESNSLPRAQPAAKHRRLWQQRITPLSTSSWASEPLKATGEARTLTAVPEESPEASRDARQPLSLFDRQGPRALSVTPPREPEYVKQVSLKARGANSEDMPGLRPFIPTPSENLYGYQASDLDMAHDRLSAAVAARPLDARLQKLASSLSAQDKGLWEAGVIELQALSTSRSTMAKGPGISKLPAIQPHGAELKRRAATLECREATRQVHEAKAAKLVQARRSQAARPLVAGKRPSFVDWDGVPRFNPKVMTDVLYAAGSGKWRRATNLYGRFKEDGATLEATEVNILFTHCATVRTVCMSKVFPFDEAAVDTDHNVSCPAPPPADVKGKHTHMYVGARNKWLPCTQIYATGCKDSQIVIKLGNGRVATRDKVDIFFYEAAGIGLEGDLCPSYTHAYWEVRHISHEVRALEHKCFSPD